MVTQQQLKKLQAYAASKDTKVTVGITEWGSVEISYDGNHFISMANKPTSFLTMKRVTAQIDKAIQTHQNL